MRQQFDAGPPGQPLEEGGQWTWRDSEEMPSSEASPELFSGAMEETRGPPVGGHVENACLDTSIL